MEILQLLAAIITFSLMWGIAISIIWWSHHNGISPMPTLIKVKRCLFAHLPPSLPSGTIYELGAGWGTLAFPLAMYYPKQLVIGLESSPIPFWLSQVLLAFHRLPNLQLKRQDFWSYPLTNPALIICYLYPKAMERLSQKFEKELPPGTWIISHTFALPGWYPVAVYEASDLYRSKIYVYRKD